MPDLKSLMGTVAGVFMTAAAYSLRKNIVFSTLSGIGGLWPYYFPSWKFNPLDTDIKNTAKMMFSYMEKDNGEKIKDKTGKTCWQNDQGQSKRGFDYSEGLSSETIPEKIYTFR